MISAINLTKKYRRGNEEIFALKGISFDINAGDFVILFGASGAGKTTLLNLIGGMDNPDEGTLTVFNKNLQKGNLVRFRRENIGFVFSDFYLIPTLTALENIAMPLLWTGRRDLKRVRELLAMVGLENRGRHYPRELSGGEMQRVAIARALVNNPKIVLADEPTANLDTKTRDKVIELFAHLNREQKITIVLASHDQELAGKGNRRIDLEDGKIIGQHVN